MKPGEGFLLWAGLTMLCAGVGIFLYNLYRIVCAKWPEERWKHAYFLVLACYPLGVGCKAALFGAGFFRFHLSDFGFPAFLALLILRYIPERNQSRRVVDYIRTRKVAVVIALILSVAYEAMTGVLWHLSKKTPELVGSFDWWDIAAYVAGCGVAVLILHRWLQIIEPVDAAYVAEMARVAEEAEHERRERRRARKRARRGRNGRKGGRI